MNLCVDIGNTNIVLGIYNKNEIIKNWRIATSSSRTTDEYMVIINQLFGIENIEKKDIKGVIISSVVPNITGIIERMIIEYLGIEPIIVGPGIKTGLNIKYDNPKEVGADRIVNAVGGFQKYGGPLIIVDFGTATTFCVITEKGDYLGGLIYPGINISVDALAQKTSKLPKVEVKKTKNIINKNTIESIQSGIYNGYIGMIKYIIKKIIEETEYEFKEIISTGGIAIELSKEVEEITVVDRDLTLEGLNIIYNMNIRKENR